MPFAHDSSVAQTSPQAPQCSSDRLGSTHLPSHAINGAAHSAPVSEASNVASSVASTSASETTICASSPHPTTSKIILAQIHLFIVLPILSINAAASCFTFDSNAQTFSLPNRRRHADFQFYAIRKLIARATKIAIARQLQKATPKRRLIRYLLVMTRSPPEGSPVPRNCYHSRKLFRIGTPS